MSSNSGCWSAAGVRISRAVAIMGIRMGPVLRWGSNLGWKLWVRWKLARLANKDRWKLTPDEGENKIKIGLGVWKDIHAGLPGHSNSFIDKTEHDLLNTPRLKDVPKFYRQTAPLPMGSNILGILTSIRVTEPSYPSGREVWLCSNFFSLVDHYAVLRTTYWATWLPGARLGIQPKYV
jgi:hypothetical protein